MRLLLLLTYLTLLACSNLPDKQLPKRITAFDLDSRLRNADSLVVVFYDDPYGPDSLRYTRYYKQVSLLDTNALMKQLGEPYMQGDKKHCRGEGKIWCYAKGKIFQTAYFSTKCDDCCFLYLIKDGNLYFSKPRSEFLSWLEQAKLMIKKDK